MIRPLKISQLILTSLIGLLLLTAGGGCASDQQNGGEFQQETTPSAKSETKKQTTPTPAGKVEGYEIYENRDPFQPLSGPGSATQTVTTTTAATSTGAGGTTTTTTTTSQSQVKLVSISGTTATINVGGTDHTGLTAGATFAESYRLLTIGSGSVTILFGDNQYTLYLGETLSVK